MSIGDVRCFWESVKLTFLAPQIRQLKEFIITAPAECRDSKPTLLDIIEKASADHYGLESGIIGKLAGIIQASQFDGNLGGPFICCTVGKEGSDGLHDGYLICPAFGANAACTTVFMKSNKLAEHQ